MDGWFHPDWRAEHPNANAFTVVESWLATATAPETMGLNLDVSEALAEFDQPEVQGLILRHMQTLSKNDRGGQDIKDWLLWLQRKTSMPAELSSEELRRVIGWIIATGIPSDGDNLLGMQIDFDAYLAQSTLLDEAEVKVSQNPEFLLLAACVARPEHTGGSLIEELRSIWQSHLRYPYFEAHSFAQPPGRIRMDFVTQLASNNLYVTGRITLRLAAG